MVGTEITGVLQTYAYADSGNANEINVFLQGTIPGTPIGGSVITAYQTALELVRPLVVFLVNYAAAPLNAIDVTITMGSFPSFTTDQKALIQTALTNFINSVHPFIASCDSVAKRNDVIATFNLSSIITQAVPGYGFSAVTFKVNTVLETYWQADLGNIPYFNSVVYV